MTGGRLVRLGCGLVAFGLIAVTALSLVGWIGETTETATHTVDARGITAIDVHTDAGAIVVTGGVRDHIEITTRASYTFAEPHFHESTVAGTLTLDAHCSRTAFGPCDVRYTIAVPQGVAVRARSGGGSITVLDVDANVDIASSAGGVRAERVGGATLRLRSSAGSVNAVDVRAPGVDAVTSAGSVRLSLLVAPEMVRARSSAGSVSVTVPDDATTYRVDADTDAGSEHVLVRTDPASPRSITATSSAGSVTVRYPTS